MKSPSLTAGRLTLLLALFAPFAGSAKNMKVMIDASADPAYVEANKDRPYQTYHFLEGENFAGYKKDPSLENIGFTEIATVVAQALAKSQFYPANQKDAGDLLIMVSWGTTSIEEDWNDLMGISDLGNEGDEVSDDFGSTTDEETNQPSDTGSAGSPDIIAENTYTSSMNRKLLGYDKGFRKSVHPWDRDRYRTDLEEERYFIILNAFDLNYLRSDRQWKQVWSTRMSTRNIGTNFDYALLGLNEAAANTFGKNVDTLHSTIVDADVTIEFGELEVIETYDLESDKKPAQE